MVGFIVTSQLSQTRGGKWMKLQRLPRVNGFQVRLIVLFLESLLSRLRHLDEQSADSLATCSSRGERLADRGMPRLLINQLHVDACDIRIRRMTVSRCDRAIRLNHGSDTPLFRDGMSTLSVGAVALWCNACSSDAAAPTLK